MAMFYKNIAFNNSSQLAVKNGAAAVDSASADENQPKVLAETNESQSITFKMGLASGDTRSITIKNPRADVDDDEVRDVAEKMVQYGSVFEDQQIKCVSASGRTTKTTKFDIS